MEYTADEVFDGQPSRVAPSAAPEEVQPVPMKMEPTPAARHRNSVETRSSSRTLGGPRATRSRMIR
jgi:hypothetical protein